jgi:phosphohistidine phosphatase
MGKRLAKRNVKPDLLVSSPALRALATAQLIAEELGYQRKRIVEDDRLYASSAEGVLAVIRGLDDKLDQVMLFGHNPEFTELARRLFSEMVEMATCAVATFRFDTKKWSDVGKVQPAESTFDRPAS